MFLSDQPFHAFGLSHGIVVLLLAACLVGLLYIVRKNKESDHLALRITLAVILIFSILPDMVTPLLRHGSQGLELIYHMGLPLYLCDIVAIVLAIALLKKSKRLTEVSYVWALAGTAQGLITPELNYGWPSIEFSAFFLQHGFVPIAAILAVWGFGWKPERGAFRRVWLWTWVFMASVMLYNLIAGTNYSFLNEKPEQVGWLDYIGPYPWYLISFHLIALILYFLLLLPFRSRGVFKK